MKISLRTRALLVAILALLAVAQTVSAQTFNFEPVTRTGLPLPVPSTLASVTSFSVNDSGQFAFAADSAVFSAANGELTTIAAVRMPAPGGGEFISATAPAINAQGQIVFRGTVTTPSRPGLFLYSDGNLTQLVADGQRAPTGEQLIVPTTPAINASGDVVFVSNTGLFMLSDGSISRIAATNSPAPGGGLFRTFSLPSINLSRQVTFSATLSNGRTGIFLASGGTIKPIAVSGTLAPTGGTYFGFLQGATLNNAGQVAFSGLVNGFVGDEGIFLYSNGQTTLLLPSFTPVPGGTMDNPQFLSLNDAGQISFSAQTLEQPASLSGIYLFSGGNISAVMLPGQTSPEGNTFTQSLFTHVTAAGQVSFIARTDNSLSTIYTASENQLTRVAGQGDFIPGAARVVGISPFGLTNDGQVLLLAATFPGGTGLFLSSADDGSDPALVVHPSQPLPGGGVLFNVLNKFSMNNSAEVVFDASNTNLTSAIMLYSGGSLSNVLRTGDPAPGGGTFLGFNSVAINDLGQILLSGGALVSGGEVISYLSGSALAPDGGPVGITTAQGLNSRGDALVFAQRFPFSNAIFLFSQGQIFTVARNGDPAPGGGRFLLPFPDPTFGPVLNSNGDVAFAADLDTGGEAVFLYSHGTVTRIAGPGDPDPSGNVILLADSPSINSAGQVAFTARVNVDGFGTFLYSNGSIVKIARPGDRVPGPDRPTLFFADLPRLNDQGQVAFVGLMSNFETGIFIATPSAGEPSTEAGPELDPSLHVRAAHNPELDPASQVQDDLVLNPVVPDAPL